MSKLIRAKTSDVFNVKDPKYGVIGNGIADDSAAIQLALNDLFDNKTEGTLYFPAGRYVLNSAVTKNITQTERNFVIKGDGTDSTILMVNNTTGGIVLTANNNRSAVHIEGLWFACEIQNAGVGFSYSQSSQVGPQSRRMFTARNCSFRPTDRTSANYFTTSLKVDGFYRPLLDNVVCWSGTAASVYIPAVCKIDNCYSPNVINSYFNGLAEIGISSVGGKEEGGWIHNTVVSGSRIGVSIVRDGREPHFSITGCHFNTRKAGVLLNGVKYFEAANNLMYCTPYDTGVDNASQPEEFYDFWLVDCEGCKFIGNQFRMMNNLKRYHYYICPSGKNEAGVDKATSVVKNIQTSNSGYYATLDAGYCPIKVVNGVSVPANLVFDLPEFMPSTDFASYPMPYWSMSPLVDTALINIGGNLVSFNETNVSDSKYHYQYSSTPADNDAVAGHQVKANNSALVETVYFSERTVLNAVASGLENASKQFFAVVNGVLSRTLSIGNGLVVGNPGIAAQGIGTIVVEGKNSLALKMSTGPGVYFGANSPEGSVTASVGSTYHRTGGGAGTSFYVKESGAGNTGWVAK